MENNRMSGGQTLRIAFGIRMLAVLLLTGIYIGTADAQTPIGSCGTISSPGDYVLNSPLSSSSTCITVTSSDVIFDGGGYTITGSSGVGTYGVFVNNFSAPLTNVTIKNLVVTHWDSGIFYNNASNGGIINNIANTNNRYGIYLSSSNSNNLTGNTAKSNPYPYGGIYIFSSSNNTLTNNTLSSDNNGIWLDSSSNNTLTNNTASSNTNGIYFHSSNSNNITNNTANFNSYVGIYLDSSSNNTLTNNTAGSNSHDGLALAGVASDSNKVIGNALNFNSYDGVELAGSNNTLTGNTANFNSNYGIYVYYPLSNNLIYNNYFNNTNDASDAGTNHWNITLTAGKNSVGGPFLGGNFWANPSGTGFSQTCPDPDNDGICDSTFSIPGGSNIDYLPLALPVTSSPVNGTSLTNVTPLTATVTAGTNATYVLNLTNTGTLTDSYTVIFNNPDTADTVGLNITSPVMLAAGASEIFALNATNTSAGIFHVNVTATSTNDPSKFAFVNTTTTVTAPSVALTVTKDFRFTDVNFTATQFGTLLPMNGSKFNVSYVIQPKTGTVASTNPGQLYGVVTVNGTGVQNITVADTFGTQFVVNPAHLDGGVDVLRVNTTTGVATVITDTQVTASSVSATGPVDLNINLTTPLASDETVMVYIKYMTSLKGMPPNYSDFVNTAVVATNLDGSKTAMAAINFVPHA